MNGEEELIKVAE